MRALLPIGIVTFVAHVTGVIVATLYRTYRPQVLTVSKEQAAIGKDQEVHARGATKATVTVEEFGDYQCPPCGALSEPLNQLERDYHNKLRLIFRNFPLANHQYALPAEACYDN